MSENKPPTLEEFTQAIMAQYSLADKIVMMGAEEAEATYDPLTLDLEVTCPSCEVKDDGEEDEDQPTFKIDPNRVQRVEGASKVVGLHCPYCGTKLFISVEDLEG